MKRFVFIAIICALTGLTSAYAQQNSFAIQYDMSVGMGNLGDYIGKTSFRGASIDYRKGVTQNIGIGFTTAWNTFYERKDYGTYTSGTQSLSGVQYRYQNQCPVLLAANYVFGLEKAFKPYVDMGVGTLYTERSTDMGLYRLEENEWHFAVKPEVGFMYAINPDAAFKLAVRYYNGFAAGDLESQNYLTVSTGFVFGY